MQQLLRCPTIICIWYSNLPSSHLASLRNVLCLQLCQFVFHLSLALLLCLRSFLFWRPKESLNGMWTSRVNLVFNFSHITQASFSESVIDSHYYTSPNQLKLPPTLSFSDSESLLDDVSPTWWRSHVWACYHSQYLILNSPFHAVMTSHLATPPEWISLEEDKNIYISSYKYCKV